MLSATLVVGDPDRIRGSSPEVVDAEGIAGGHSHSAQRIVPSVGFTVPGCHVDAVLARWLSRFIGSRVVTVAEDLRIAARIDRGDTFTDCREA